MVIFLTGGTGFIGKRFIKLAIKNDHSIYAITRKKKNSNVVNLKWLEGEINHDWSKYIKKSDVIVHLAAEGIKKNSSKNKFHVIDFNVNKTISFFLNAIKIGCKKFIIASSSSEYSHNGLCKNNLTINSKRNFSSVYSFSKIIVTDIMRYLSGAYNINARIMRIFPVYGPGEDKNRLFPKLVKMAKDEKDLKIINPYETRDITHVDEVAKSLLEACNFSNKRNFEIYHISSGKSTKVIDFCKFIWKKNKAKGKLIFNKRSKKYKRHVSDKNSIWQKIN